MAVGGTAGGRAGSSQAAAAGRFAAGRLAAAAFVGTERERASRGGSCCSPWRQERSASRKELCAGLSASSGRGFCRYTDALLSAAQVATDALSLGAVGGGGLLRQGESRASSWPSPKSKAGAAADRSRAVRALAVSERWAAISPAQKLGGSRCQGKQGDQQRAARPRTCTLLRKPTLYYLRLDSPCTAHCCIIVHSW